MADTESNNINVGDTERKASVVAGSALAVYGLSRRSWGGALLALVGGSLIYRGTTGHCAAYQALGTSTEGDEQPGQANSQKPGANGVQVREVVTINKSPEELYSFWRNFENLPKFMLHLESVTTQEDGRSHWVAKAPLGRTVEWDAEIINEEPNRLIAWQSLPGADVASAGSVRFEPATGGRGTAVRVNLDYNPPGGVVGATVAKLLGEEPQIQIAEDLRRFKNLMETGETPTVEGQPVGARSTKGAALDKAQAAHAA